MPSPKINPEDYVFIRTPLRRKRPVHKTIFQVHELSEVLRMVVSEERRWAEERWRKFIESPPRSVIKTYKRCAAERLPIPNVFLKKWI